MKPIQLPEHVMPAKPKFGEACNHCGLCCSVSLCNLGLIMFGDIPAPCPALVIENGRSQCGFMVAEIKTYGRPGMIADVLAAGKGCTMEDYWLEKYGDMVKRI